MSRTTHIVAVLGLLLVATIGCSKFTGGDNATNTNGQGNVAIIDLDMVAKQLGYDTQIAGAIQQQKSSLQKQLGVIKANFEQELTKTKNQIGESPTPEQAKQFQQSNLVANQKFSQEAKKANLLLNRYSAQVIQQFRNTVKTTARQVAADKGLSIILTKNDIVFDYDMAVDITDAVIERMRAEQSSNTNNQSTPTDAGTVDSPTAENQQTDYPRP